jgi:spore germination cell wall hydrolase CwlJ-like protein
MDIHISEHDVHCIATAVYVEVNTQSLEEKLGVINVIMNRVRSKRFGRDACEVVYARGQFVGIENMMKANEKNIDQETLLKTKLLVIDTLLFKKHANPVGDSLYFHDDSVDMRYIWDKKPNITIGRMVFYK